jgi:pimeloyl-ACP methyl ester carboxylesterase
MGLAWRRGTTHTNGVTLAWEECGPVNGEPLLLVMGLGGQLILWPESFCATLIARGFRVIRFDNRDSGLSGDGNCGVRFNIRNDMLRSRFGLHTRTNYTLYDMSADTVGLMDAMGIRSAHLVGVSMGGMISQITAGRYPRRVRSLTSIMSTTNHPRLPPPRMRVLWHMFGRRPRTVSRELMIQRAVRTFKLIGSPAYPTPDAELHRLANVAYSRAFRPGGTLRQTHAILATGSFEHCLPMVKAPTQVIHGLADPLLRPSCGRRSAKLIRGARLELMSGMGHDFPMPLMPHWAELIADNAARA